MRTKMPGIISPTKNQAFPPTQVTSRTKTPCFTPSTPDKNTDLRNRARHYQRQPDSALAKIAVHRSGQICRALLPVFWTKPAVKNVRAVHRSLSTVHRSVPAVHHSVQARATFRPNRATPPRMQPK
jgi:hypothetical protein